jgi:hypothetical protein
MKRTRTAYSVNAAKTNTPTNATAIARRARKNFVIAGDAGTAGLVPPRTSAIESRNSLTASWEICVASPIAVCSLSMIFPGVRLRDGIITFFQTKGDRGLFIGLEILKVNPPRHAKLQRRTDAGGESG